MDKGKNRNDLLAAGRKKLQQYRKKKDNKGSNSNSGNSKGKASSKSTDPEAVSTANADQLDANLASDNGVGEDLRGDTEDVSVNHATDQQVAETEAVLTSLDQVEASGSTSLHGNPEDKRKQEDADPSNYEEISHFGSENPIHEEERENCSTCSEEREEADGERIGEVCSRNETSASEILQHDLNPDNVISTIYTEHPTSLEEESGVCINPETEISAKGTRVEESLESIKRELYLMGLSRDLLQSKLDEEMTSSTEISKELMQCKSELLDVMRAKEEVDLQLACARQDIDSCNSKCEKLETELGISKEKLENAFSQLEALESENASIKQEREQLEGVKDILSMENNKLSTEFLAQKERLVRLESSIKETGTCVERLVEENIYLSSSFNLHRSILIEADENSTTLPKLPSTYPNYSTLNLHIEESKNILGNLRSSIESMRGRSISFNKRGGITNLIKAYESQVTQVGTVASDEVVSAEASEDPYEISVQFVGSLERALNQMKLDLMNTNDQYEEGGNAVENSKEDCTAIKEKIDGLSVIFNTYQDKINNLQEQFSSVQKEADDEAVRLLGQLEELQNETNGRFQKLGEERDSMVSAVSEAILRFNSCMGLSVPDKLSPDSADVGPILFTLVDSAVQSIERLRMENSTLQNRNEISFGLIRQMHDKLQNTINYSEHVAGEIMSSEGDLELISNSYEALIEHVQVLVEEGAGLLSMKKELESALALKSKEAEEFSVKCSSLSENLNDFCLIKKDLESILMGKNLVLEELHVRCLALANKMRECEEVADVASGDRENELLNSILPQLESSVALSLEKHDRELAEIDLSKKYLYEANAMPDVSPEKWALPLHILLSGHLLPKLSEMRERMDLLSGSNIELQTEIQVLRDSLKEMEVSVRQSQLELNRKTTELVQSEQRLSSVKEKLGIAVSKGKGLIVQRDSLKQSLQEKSSELERCMQQLTEAEDKLKSYGEADRIEALESELSYIRNSYNVLRDSFLIKDSVIQRIEEVLEELDFPEEFHARDIAEKVEVLSRMAVPSWNSSSMQVESPVQVELPQESSDAGNDEMNRYATLERKFCEVAEHNNILEQSLLERNGIIKKWEEVLAHISIIPPQIRDLDAEERINWLVKTLFDTQGDRDALQLKIESLEESSEMLIVDLEGSRKRISELNAELAAVRSEKEFFSDSLDKLRFDYEVERENMSKQLSDLREKIPEKIEVENEILRLVDIVQKALPNDDSYEELSGVSSFHILEKLVNKLLEERNVGSFKSRDPVDLEALEKNISLIEEVQRLKVEIVHMSEKYQEVVGEHELAVKQRDSLLQQLEGLEELSRRISMLEEERAHSSKKHQELGAEMELVVEQRNTLQLELQHLQERQLQEAEALNGRISLLESELELTVGQRNTLQEQLNDLHQLQDKHVQELGMLNARINLLEEERTHEPEKHQKLVSELESTVKERNVLQEQLNQVREKLNVAVRKGKGLVQQRDGLKQQIENLEAEKSSLLSHLEENIQLLNRFSTVLHTVEADSVDPIQKVEAILKSNTDLKMAVASAEAEANKSRRATELLLAELNESQERNDMLQEELERMRRKQMEGMREMSLAVGKLRDISFEILRNIVGKLHKDVGIMSYMEEFMSLMTSGVDGPGSSSDYTSSLSLLDNDLSTRQRNHANHYPFGPKPDEWDENIIAYIRACAQELHDLKISIDNTASLVDQKGSHLLRSMSFAQKELESLQSDVNKLRTEMREKEEEKSLLSHNLSLLYESCSRIIDEAEADLTNRPWGALQATPLMNEDHIQSLVERLVGAIRSEVRTKELKSTIMELQRELQEKDLQVSQISSELSSQIRDSEKKVHELEKQVEAMGSEKAALQLHVNQLQDVEFSSNQLRERVSYYTDILAKKEQEIESLMQALDEQEKEMEEMEIKNKQLQNLVQEKEISLKSLEGSNSKVSKKLSIATAKFDELHHLSENLIVEVENLQLQLEGRDSEISFLRQEVTRVTNELLSSDETYKRYAAHLQDFAKWVQTLVLRFGLSYNESDELDYGKIKEYMEALDRKLGSVVAELDELHVGMQSRDALLQIERGKVTDLVRKCEGLESSLRERSVGASTSGVLEIEHARETVMNVRSGRKGNNANTNNNGGSDQVAISIDQDVHDHPLDEDDDKAHGFKPLTMSRFVPRFTRRIADRVDGMWVSGDRLLMRQPTLRIGVLIYWIILHAMLASSI
ncbi:nucleoporin [Rhynchospora pubera]|uniref:Nucleoporin n=1 Tax=Rhynchospora pubera TaxID=906938 RepID=A0AAV8DAJ6_9POAL|nr:nucleoporin [Rhynchospora pubera]